MPLYKDIPGFPGYKASEDGNSFNNSFTNLCWGTRTEDAEDKRRHGTSNGGTWHGMSKLTVAQVMEIRTNKESCISLGKRFSVSRETIRRARNGESWEVLK